jgi:hypothetical protein
MQLRIAQQSISRQAVHLQYRPWFKRFMPMPHLCADVPLLAAPRQWQRGVQLGA